MSNNEKYLVTGAAGQLGQHLQNTWGGEEGNALPRAKEAFDISDRAQVEEWLPGMNPDAVVNCAGYTNVQRAEEDRLACWRANVVGVQNLARVCSANDIALFHISSDFVFGQDEDRHPQRLPALDPTRRKNPTREQQERSVCYDEADAIGPVGFSGQTKAMAEHVILQEALANPDFQYYIIRTAGMFEPTWRLGRNFPYAIASRLLSDTIREVEVVSDVVTNITYVPHIANALRWLVEKRNEISVEGVTIPVGIYHITNTGMASWWEIAQHLDQLMGFSGKLRATSRIEYCKKHGLRAELSPACTALCSNKYEETLGPSMPTWQEGLAAWAKEATRYLSRR